ncbi:MAG: helix-turn-helix domain-containing protein [Planctomycetota bacterium]
MVRSGNKLYKVSEGKSFLCTRTGSDFSYYYPEEAVTPWKFFYISFYYDVSAIKDLINKFGHIYQISPENEVIKYLLSFKGKGNCQLIKASEGFEMVSNLLSTLINSKESDKKKSNSEVLVSKVTEMVLKRIPNDIRVSEIAERLDISKEHLCRVFKKESGYTLQNFIIRQRIYYACDLLKNSSKSLKEISFILDYDTQSHFARSFKKITGNTPGEYRLNSISQFY